MGTFEKKLLQTGLLLLAGCGLKYDEGQIERGRLNCKYQDLCGNLGAMGYEDVNACISDAEAQTYDEAQCPGYSSKVMDECLDAYQKAIDANDCAATFEEVCVVCTG